MSSGGVIGDAMAKSLVTCLGGDCAAAAALAATADLRRGGILDEGSIHGVPRGALLRVIDDFVRRGWLVRQGSAWQVPEEALPVAAPAFLAGMTAMRRLAEEEAALTAVTLPLPPSAIAKALPSTGLTHAALVSTEDAMGRVADAAVAHLTVLTPFLNEDGLGFALRLFERSRAEKRTLVVRGSAGTRTAIKARQEHLKCLRVTVLNCLLHAEGGYETFHAKVVLADDQLAYVGSANLLGRSRDSMELGSVVRGRAATVVASVVRAVESVSSDWDWHR